MSASLSAVGTASSLQEFAALLRRHGEAAQQRAAQLRAASETVELEVSKELLDGIRGAERCLNALDTLFRRTLPASAEAALSRTNGVSARAKHPANKHQSIRDAWTKLTIEGEPARQIAAKVAQRCSCTPTYARRIAKEAGIQIEAPGPIFDRACLLRAP